MQFWILNFGFWSRCMKNRTLVVIVSIVLFAACGGEKGKGGGAAGNAKDTLVIAFKASPTNLDPRVGNDQYAGRVYDLICSGLIKVTPNLDYAPDLAEKWETPD